jgi:hypothetical protein
MVARKRIGLWRADRIVAVEQFEIEDLELARARFEELRDRAD